MSTVRDGLMLLRKGDRGKVICAAIAKSHTAVGNDWLAERLAMGHGSYVSSLVNRIRRDQKEQKTLKSMRKYGKSRTDPIGDVIARDIWELRRVYPDMPNADLQRLIEMNKTMYPSSLAR